MSAAEPAGQAHDVRGERGLRTKALRERHEWEEDILSLPTAQPGEEAVRPLALAEQTAQRGEQVMQGTAALHLANHSFQSRKTTMHLGEHLVQLPIRFQEQGVEPFAP